MEAMISTQVEPPTPLLLPTKVALQRAPRLLSSQISSLAETSTNRPVAKRKRQSTAEMRSPGCRLIHEAKNVAPLRSIRRLNGIFGMFMMVTFYGQGTGNREQGIGNLFGIPPVAPKYLPQTFPLVCFPRIRPSLMTPQCLSELGDLGFFELDWNGVEHRKSRICCSRLEFRRSFLPSSHPTV